MTQTALPWALLVVGNPSKSAGSAHSQATVDPPSTVLARALSLTSIAKTSCLLDPRLHAEWHAVIQQLWPENVAALVPEERVVDGVLRRLEAIAAQEPRATVILIPYNHCAVEELSWLDSAKGALRLGSGNQNTVYLLHDSPHNDPRITSPRPDVCTSSVMVGSTAALAALCQGNRKTTVVDLVVEKPLQTDLADTTTSITAHNTPLNVVHVRLVEEYVRLQQPDLWHRKTRQIDLHA